MVPEFEERRRPLSLCEGWPTRSLTSLPATTMSNSPTLRRAPSRLAEQSSTASNVDEYIGREEEAQEGPRRARRAPRRMKPRVPLPRTGRTLGSAAGSIVGCCSRPDPAVDDRTRRRARLSPERGDQRAAPEDSATGSRLADARARQLQTVKIEHLPVGASCEPLTGASSTSSSAGITQPPFLRQRCGSSRISSAHRFSSASVGCRCSVAVSGTQPRS